MNRCEILLNSHNSVYSSAENTFELIRSPFNGCMNENENFLKKCSFENSHKSFTEIAISDLDFDNLLKCSMLAEFHEYDLKKQNSEKVTGSLSKCS